MNMDAVDAQGIPILLIMPSSVYPFLIQECPIGTENAAIPISTIRREAGDSKEQRNPIFVKITACLVAQSPEKINFS
jgi:hypothetical protein